MFRTLLLMVLASVSASAYASNATLQVDQTNIEKDQTITATFNYKGKLESEPDFSALEKDFTVVSQGLSKSVEIINGNYREQQTWNTVLLPKRVGALVVPAIDFGGELSNTVTLNVAPPKPGSDKDLGDLFLETELTPDGDGYVQQQHIFTLRIYFRGWLIDGDLSDPQLDNQDVVVQSLGEPRRYSVMRNGERYQVYERRHALFPQASGELRLGETTFSGRLRLPVGGNRLKSVSTPAITRTVLPVPSQFSGDVWLPAESLAISEVWPSDKLTFEQGVPITRTVTMSALGLTSAQLPSLSFEGNDDVRIYPDQPKSGDQIGEKGVIGTRAVAIAMVPQRSGEIELPAVELKWWDTATNRERVARLEGKTLSVLAAAGASNAAVSEGVIVESTQSTSLISNPWFYATLVCALGWLLTSLLRSSRGSAVALQPAATRQSKGSAQRFKTACDKNDAKACAHLFGEILREGTNSSSNTTNMNSSWFDGQDGEELKRQWKALNRTLYGRATEQESWSSGRDLWRAFEQVRVARNKPQKARESLAQLAPTA